MIPTMIPAPTSLGSTWDADAVTDPTAVVAGVAIATNGFERNSIT